MSDDNTVENLTIRVLHGIRHDLRELTQRVDAGFEGLTLRMDGLNERVDGLNERVDGLNERVDGLNERVDGLTQHVNGLERATIAGFEGVQKRLESIRELAGDHWRDHETRIQRLEDHTGLG